MRWCFDIKQIGMKYSYMSCPSARNIKPLFKSYKLFLPGFFLAKTGVKIGSDVFAQL